LKLTYFGRFIKFDRSLLGAQHSAATFTPRHVQPFVPAAAVRRGPPRTP